MSTEQQTKPLSGAECPGPREAFTDYCEAEFENRRNTGESFEEQDYREAMEMVLRSLRTLEEG